MVVVKRPRFPGERDGAAYLATLPGELRELVHAGGSYLLAVRGWEGHRRARERLQREADRVLSLLADAQATESAWWVLVARAGPRFARAMDARRRETARATQVEHSARWAGGDVDAEIALLERDR